MFCSRSRSWCALGALILCLTAIPAAPASDAPDADATHRDVFNVRDFGAVGDGEHDDTDAIQAAIDAAVNARSAVYLPRGTYAVSRPIRVALRTYSWARSVRITGDWARLLAIEPMEMVLHVDIASHLTIERLVLDGNDKAEHGFVGFKISGRRALIERVQVTRARSHGFVLEKCQGAVFRGCDANRNGGDGWHIVDCNAAVFQDCVGNNNAGNGFTVTRMDFSGGCVLNNLWAENNQGHGVLVDGTRSTVALRSGWVEGNGRDGVRIAAHAVVARELHITGRGNGNTWAVHLVDGADGAVVQNNSMAPGAGDSLYARVRVEQGVERYHIQNNRRLGIHGAPTVEPIYGPPALPPDAVLEPVGPNLLENPSFAEDGGWPRLSGDVESHGPTTEHARSHDRAYRITGTGSAGVQQPIALEPGARYRLSGWMLVEEGIAEIAAHNGDNLIYGFCRADEAEWTYREMDFTAAGTSGYVMLRLAQRGDAPSTAYFDDIELHKLARVDD